MSVRWKKSFNELIISVGNQDFKNGYVEVYSLNGSRVIQRSIVNNHEVINLSNIPEGLYIARIRIGKKVITKKLVK